MREFPHEATFSRAKVMADLRFGILALIVDQWLKLSALYYPFSPG